MPSIEINGSTEPGELPRLARWWFEAAAGSLLAGVIGGLRDGAVALPRSSVAAGDRPWGEPGSMWAALARYRRMPGRATSRRAWSARGWETFLEGLADLQAGVEMQLVELDARGYPRHADTAAITMHVLGQDRRWFRLGCEFAAFPHGPGHRIARVTEDEARRFLWEAVQELPVTYGGLGDDGQLNGPTMLESRICRDARTGLLESGRVLRAYPWVTVCAPDIAGRLGGPEALRASGAFHEVRRLPSGSVWLRATERLADYEGEALHRVFRTVAPALPPGRPEPYVGREIGRIVYEDAATWRPGP